MNIYIMSAKNGISQNGESLTLGELNEWYEGILAQQNTDATLNSRLRAQRALMRMPSLSSKLQAHGLHYTHATSR